jgi:hypothetical protein
MGTGGSYTVELKLAQYKQELINHVSRTEDIRYPKEIIDLLEEEEEEEEEEDLDNH